MLSYHHHHHHHHHPHLLLHVCLSGYLNSTGLTDQAPVLNVVPNTVKNKLHILRITVSVFENTEQGEYRAVLNSGVTCLQYHALWTVLAALYRPFPVAIFLLIPPPLQVYTSGASRWCCCDCWELLQLLGVLVCFFVCLFGPVGLYDRSIVMGSSANLLLLLLLLLLWWW